MIGMCSGCGYLGYGVLIDLGRRVGVAFRCRDCEEHFAHLCWLAAQPKPESPKITSPPVAIQAPPIKRKAPVYVPPEPPPVAFLKPSGFRLSVSRDDALHLRSL